MRRNVDRLSADDCRLFFRHFLKGLLENGLLEPLRSYSGGPPAAVSAARSWHEALVAGLPVQEAVRHAAPPFPQPIEQLVAAAAIRGVLDKAVSELLAAYDRVESEEALLEEASRLAGRYESASSSGAICTECLEREFRKIFDRARVEQASEVILDQEGDMYFHQRFLGVKLVWVTEPSHGLIFRSMWELLAEGSESSVTFGPGRTRLRKKRLSKKRFRVTMGEEELVMEFR